MSTKLFIFSFILSLQVFAVSPAVPSEDEKLVKIMSSYLQKYGEIDSFWNSRISLSATDRYNSFGDYLNDSYYEKREKLLQKTSLELLSLNKQNLSEERKMEYSLFTQTLSILMKKYTIEPTRYLHFSTRSNRALQFMYMANPANTKFPFLSKQNYLDFIERMKSFTLYSQNLVKNERIGLDKGYTEDCASIKSEIDKLSPAVNDLQNNPFIRPLKTFPQSISKLDQLEISSRFKFAIQNEVIPAYLEILKFLKAEYLPKCRNDGGLFFVPKGQELYKQLIADNVGQFIAPEWLFKTGLSEVKRIEKGFDEVKTALNFHGSTAEFLNKMRTDQNSYFKNKSELLLYFNKINLEIQNQLPLLFQIQPKSEFVIKTEEIPGNATYTQPTELNNTGTIWLATASLRTFPKYGATTLMLHEGIPGHHFQLAINFENKNISKFRKKIFNSTAFVEGWALYAESLGYEMGLYKDPLQKFGNLSDDMLRAVRLVVDTGLHYYGWKRPQALQYMIKHLPFEVADLEIEIDRYIANPAQAIAYKVGQLKIRSLRTFAEQALGERFNLKEFHQIVLESGTISLECLEEKVKTWVNAGSIQ